MLILLYASYNTIKVTVYSNPVLYILLTQDARNHLCRKLCTLGISTSFRVQWKSYKHISEGFKGQGFNPKTAALPLVLPNVAVTLSSFDTNQINHKDVMLCRYIVPEWQDLLACDLTRLEQHKHLLMEVVRLTAPWPAATSPTFHINKSAEGRGTYMWQHSGSEWVYCTPEIFT